MNDSELEQLLLTSLKEVLTTSSSLPAFHPELDLVDTGLLDSIAFLELISQLEDRVGNTFDLFEIPPTDLTTMGGLLTLLQVATSSHDSRTSAAE